MVGIGGEEVADSVVGATGDGVVDLGTWRSALGVHFYKTWAGEGEDPDVFAEFEGEEGKVVE